IKTILVSYNLTFQSPPFFFFQGSEERCLEPMSEGSCSDYALLWYFHAGAGECRPFVYGGCSGNGNRFASLLECRACCVLMPERGRGGKAGFKKSNNHNIYFFKKTNKSQLLTCMNASDCVFTDGGGAWT
uniref:BPTI/Kunitz inhibitor domain-containing protein n=1 Tax=Hippocampus comes TaxID=109280 RepID=A0A3Q2YLS5_HIPCM